MVNCQLLFSANLKKLFLQPPCKNNLCRNISDYTHWMVPMAKIAGFAVLSGFLKSDDFMKNTLYLQKNIEIYFFYDRMYTRVINFLGNRTAKDTKGVFGGTI